MKKLIYIAVAAAMMLASCGKEQAVKVSVNNPIDQERTEVVAVNFDEVAAKLPAITAENVVVYNAAGEEITSQVFFNGDEPQLILFQPTVAANGSAEFSIEAGTPAEYEQKVFGRYVPERKDDYSWENNVIAFRSYGKALEVEMVSPGIDVWVKCSDKLVINEWVANEQKEANWYHHNHGDGLDCYKVGVTLGGGASVPYVDGTLVYPEHNWQTYTDLANGPLVKMFALTYLPYNIGGEEISLTKVYTIEANSNFCIVKDVFSKNGQGLGVAAGTIRHNVKNFAQGENWYAMYEAASDSSDPERDGDIALAMIVPAGGEVIENGDKGHALIVGEATEGCTGDTAEFQYVLGAGWSQGNVPSAEVWAEMVADKAEAIANPLEVVIK